MREPEGRGATAKREPGVSSPLPSGRGAGGEVTATSEKGAAGEVSLALQTSSRLTASALVEATGLDAASVKKALKALVDGGQVRVEGKARGTSYHWVR